MSVKQTHNARDTAMPITIPKGEEPKPDSSSGLGISEHKHTFFTRS